MPRVATLMVLTPVHVRLVLISLEMEKNVVRLYIHLFQKTLSKRTTNGSCRTEIGELKQTRRQRKRERHLKMQLRLSAILFQLFKVIMLEKRVLTILELNWNQRLRH